MQKNVRMLDFEKLGNSLTKNQIRIIDAMIPKVIRDAMEPIQKAERFVDAAERNPAKVEKFQLALLERIENDTLRTAFAKEINNLNSKTNEMFNLDLMLIQ